MVTLFFENDFYSALILRLHWNAPCPAKTLMRFIR